MKIFFNESFNLGKFTFGAIFCSLPRNPLFGVEVNTTKTYVQLNLYIYGYGLELEVERRK